MAINVSISSRLQSATGGSDNLSVLAADVRDLISKINILYPGFASKVLKTSEEIEPYVTVWIGNEKAKGVESRLIDGCSVRFHIESAGG